MNPPVSPQIEFVLQAQVQCDPMIVIGPSSRGARQLIPIVGGEFAGPKLQGRVLPGGADWQLTRPDGVLEIEARYTLQTDDGVNISVHNRGMAVYPANFAERRARGEAIDPATIYVRTVPEFEAPAVGRYAWLNNSIFVGNLQPLSRQPLIVQVQMFQVL